MKLLAVNTGSSSVRLAVYGGEAGSLRLLTLKSYSGEALPQNTLRDFPGSERVDAVAHRVVHGGKKLTATVTMVILNCAWRSIWA